MFTPPLRVLVAIVLAAAAAVVAPAATAKDFDPGDLRICDATHCVPVTNRVVLAELAEF